MEVAVVLEMLSAQIVDLAVEEMIITIMGSKCCLWSKRKWKKVRKHMERDKHERSMRITDSMKRNNIFEYAVKIDEKKTIKSTFV